MEELPAKKKLSAGDKWLPQKVTNYCSLNEDDFEEITFVASDFDNWSSLTTQKKFEDDGSVHLGPNPRRVSVCSQYLYWLSGLFTESRLPPKTLSDIEIWETKPSSLFLLFKSDNVASEAYRLPSRPSLEPQEMVQEVKGLGVSCKVKEFDIQPLHAGDPMDLENARKNMSVVQRHMDDLNRDCSSIKVLNVTGLYGDALMLWSPFGQSFDATGKGLLMKVGTVVFKPGSIVAPIKGSECPKIDKFLDDNPSLKVCFERHTFELSNVGNASPDFMLKNRDRVTVIRPTFVRIVRGISNIDKGLNAAQELSNFAHVVL
jgi:hypothetical protein